MPNASSETDDHVFTIRTKCLWNVLKLGIAILTFLLLNYVVFLFLRLFLGRNWLTILVIFLGYYFLVRKVVTYIVFPGCFPLYRRKLENGLQEQMGRHILDQIREFSLCIDMYRSGQLDPGMDDFSRTQFLAASSKQVRFMVTAYSKQMQAQRMYHKKILQAENRHFSGQLKKNQTDTVQTTGVHADQATFVAKLKAVKRLMFKTKLVYKGEEMSVWDFAGLGDSNQSDDMSPIGYYDKAIFEDKVRKSRLLSLCEALTDCETFVGQIFEELDLKASFKRWMSLKIFGTFEQLRTEMELRYPEAETVILRTYDHKRIHGYWIPGRAIDTDGNPVAPNTLPTMILCGPNAMYAEQVQYDTDLLGFYIENGINVMVYNYRGYGLSQGSPTIANIRQDAEIVAMYVRQRVGAYARVGVHGRSIGGVVATHLARKGQVEFLFADRTFRSLERAAKHTVGAWAFYALPFFTFWFDTDLTTDYIFASCYKVMSNDPNDEIINDSASLKTGVAKKIINDELKVRLMEQAFKLRSSVADNAEDGQAVLVLPKSQFGMQSRAIVRYHHILNSQETNILFKNFFEIFQKIEELQLHNKRIRKKLRSSLNSSKMADTNRTLNQSITSEFIGGTYGFETARSVNNSEELMLKEDRHSKTSTKSGGASTAPGGGDIELGSLQHQSDRDVDVSVSVASSVFSSPRNLLSNTSVTQPDINSALSASRGHLIRHKRTRELERKYRKQTGDQKTDFADFLQFLLQFYKSTQRLDAAGCTLQKVFGLVEDSDTQDSSGKNGGPHSNRDGAERSPSDSATSKKTQAQMRTMFKHWILNLDVYGSFEPLNPQCYDIQMARTASFTKLAALRKRLRKMIEFWEDISEESGRLMHSVIQQVELIDFYLHKIEFYFSKKQPDEDAEIYPAASLPKESNAFDDSDEDIEELEKRMSSIKEDEAEDEDSRCSPGINKQSSKTAKEAKATPQKKRRANQIYDVNINNSASKSTGNLSARSTGSQSARKRQLSHFDLQDEYIKFKDFSEPNIIKTGYLIPLKCGHNGNMSLNERTIFEIHLTNAGFIQPQQMMYADDDDDVGSFHNNSGDIDQLRATSDDDNINVGQI